MPRVKRAVIHLKKRRTLRRQTKGFEYGRRTRIRLARPAVLKAGRYAYRDRKVRKREFRSLWQIKINAAVRPLGMSYSQFINRCAKAKLGLDRKSLAHLAEHYPKIFAKIVETVKA